MSAPSTNTEKQARRHKPALIGIAVAAILGGLFFLLNMGSTIETETPPADGIATEEAALPTGQDG